MLFWNVAGLHVIITHTEYQSDIFSPALILTP